MLKFKCSCGCDQLEEILDNVTARSLIKSIGEDGDMVYGEVTNEDGDTVTYQCFECGELIKDEDGTIHDCVRLAEYLKEQSYNKSQELTNAH